MRSCRLILAQVHTAYSVRYEPAERSSERTHCRANGRNGARIRYAIGAAGVRAGRDANHEAQCGAVFPASQQGIAHRRAILALDRRGSSLPEMLIRPLSTTATSRSGGELPTDRSPLADELTVLERQWAAEAARQLPFLPGVALQRLRRGHLLAEQNQQPVARRWYASIPTGNGYDVQLIAPALVARATLAEEQGSHAQAARLYERFADLWADCEPQPRPAVTEARRRATRLRELADSGG